MLEKDAFDLFALVEQALGDACGHAALFADASEDARQIGERRLFPGSSEGSPWYRDRPCIRSPSPFPSQEQAAMKRSGSQMVPAQAGAAIARSEEHTSELQSLMRISYAVFCLKKKKKHRNQ